MREASAIRSRSSGRRTRNGEQTQVGRRAETDGYTGQKSERFDERSQNAAGERTPVEALP